MTDADTTQRRCPWCDAVAPEHAITCPACGAALAQREDLGGLAIPGVTAVDPALADLADRPIHLRGPSPTQGVASGAVVAAVAGGPIGLAIAGGVAAMAAAEYLGAHHDGATTPGRVEDVGRPSDLALQVAARLAAEEAGEATGEGDAARARERAESGVVDGSAGNSDNSTRD